MLDHERAGRLPPEATARAERQEEVSRRRRLLILERIVSRQTDTQTTPLEGECLVEVGLVRVSSSHSVFQRPFPHLQATDNRLTLLLPPPVHVLRVELTPPPCSRGGHVTQICSIRTSHAPQAGDWCRDKHAIHENQRHGMKLFWLGLGFLFLVSLKRNSQHETPPHLPCMSL